MGSRRCTPSLQLHLLALISFLLLQVVPISPEEVTTEENSKDFVTSQYQNSKEELATAQTTTTLSGTQSILLQHAVKDLLGFKELPAAAETAKTRGEKWDHKGGPRGRDEAPKYMMKLYEKYKYGGAISNGQQSGNTVRSISATIEMLNGEPNFVFNMSSISSSELVFSSDIHVYRKRPKSPDQENNAHLILNQVAPPNYLTHLASLRMTSTRFGWQSYDVTSSVQNCLQKPRDQQRLAVSFASSRVMTSGNALPLKHFIRHNVALPFLIVFSNDTQNITLDHIDPHFAVKDVRDVIIDPEFGVEVPLFGKRKRKSRKHHSHKKASVSEETASQLSSEVEEKDEIEVEPKSTEETPALNRRKRSIFDNEIPEHPTEVVEPDAAYNVPRTHPGILQGRGQSRPQIPVTSSQQLIPYPDDYDEDDASYKKRRRKERRRNRKKKGRERNGKNKSNGDRTLPFPPEWERELAHQENTIKVGSQDYLCGRKRLAVDFADIGWSDWIISPRSFEAHYCAGGCPFPLTKALKPSNHATIQSLVHAIGIPANVPAPCCVPDSLTSVTLLFFDENRNVVLKNYPAMSVESCACR